MLDSIKIVIDKTIYGHIKEIHFTGSVESVIVKPAKIIVPDPIQPGPIPDCDEIRDNEFIDDWTVPDHPKDGLIKIRVFKIERPSLIVTFSFEKIESAGALFYVDVLYIPNPQDHM